MKKNYYSQLNNKTKYKEYLYSGFLGKLFNINHQLMEKFFWKYGWFTHFYLERNFKRLRWN
jgi:hypothetical protein